MKVMLYLSQESCTLNGDHCTSNFSYKNINYM